jgi:hypothetical protein
MHSNAVYRHLHPAVHFHQSSTSSSF